MSTSDFTKKWVNLAQEELGAKVLYATDDFFAPKERMIQTQAPVFIEDKYDDNGKWMDGWESRRKRGNGYDYCIVKLGLPGIIHGLNIDTSNFTGNFAPSASIDVCYSQDEPNEHTEWVEILAANPLGPDCHHLFEITDNRPWNYVRLNIYPDGGVARLRVYGEVVTDQTFNKEESIDLIALVNGGRALSCNNEHFGTMHNIIKPHPPVNMGDGWETRRRREPGYDWAIYALACVGTVEKIIVETEFFKGNFPDSCSIQGALMSGGSEETIATQSLFWSEILPQNKLQANDKKTFTAEISNVGPISHIRLNIFPDGGISRLRVFGKPTDK